MKLRYWLLEAVMGGVVHYSTKYVYLVTTETVWCSACRLMSYALIFPILFMWYQLRVILPLKSK